MSEREELNKLTEQIIGGAIRVHRALGPGLLKSAYETCSAYETTEAGLLTERQVPLPLLYREVKLDCGYRLDMLVAQKVIVEVKTVETLLPIHKAQLLSYLKLSGCKVGLLINFNVQMLKDGGIVRLVNGSL